MPAKAPLPLQGIRVLDFTTLLPGPLATLMLADAGAAVVKVESPKGGDRGRLNMPRDGGESPQFAQLNRGKKSVAVDLKSAEGRAAIFKLAAEADVLVEQFRPGVLARLGLGYEAVREVNPRIVYCSITGYGQTGPLADVAGHDLNYIARSGMLSLSVGADGVPVIPQGAIADIGGGSMPALINILLALYRRRDTGQGCYLDIAMSENTLSWMARAMAPALLGLPIPPASEGRHTGGSPRYGIYLARDRTALAVAALEPHFWARFCELLELPPETCDDEADPKGVKRRVQEAIAGRDGAYWLEKFRGEDVCVDVIQDVGQALRDPHYAARKVWERRLRLNNGRVLPALPLPIMRDMLDDEERGYPALGSHRPDDPGLWQCS